MNAGATTDRLSRCPDCGKRHIGPPAATVESETRAWLRDVHGLGQKLDDGDLVGCAAGDELEVDVAFNGCDVGALLWVVDLYAVAPGGGGRRRPSEAPVVHVRWSAGNGFTFEGPV